MIKNFVCKETEKIFNRQISLKLPRDIQKTSRRKLEILEGTGILRDLRIPPKQPSRENYRKVGRGNIVSVLIVNGVYALNGRVEMLTTLK